jgi:PAS domain-containing protein
VSLRADLVWAVRAPPDAFRGRHRTLRDRHGLDAALARRATETGPETVDGDRVVTGYDGLSPRVRRLVWRLWTLDTAPLGLTLAGPAYADNPVVYATRTVRELTGHALADLRGENLRVLQGPETEAAPVADLRAAIASWDEVTVELTNRRADGTPFRNRVSLAPLRGTDGTVAHWLGVQARVDG